MTSSNYPGANRTAQWYQDNYPGAAMHPNVVVLHTTEGGDWPSYSGGAVAPTLTVKANKATKRLDVRQHFPLDHSARALRNESGGVQTNTLNCIQIELVGSCADKGGYGAIYWPDAPDWCYVELGKLLAELHTLFPAIPLTSDLEWLAYGPDKRRPGVKPASYGASPARMTFAEWRSFTGICGHQHVPENVHGDPGDLPIAKVLGYARADKEGRTNMPQNHVQKLRAGVLALVAEHGPSIVKNRGVVARAWVALLTRTAKGGPVT